MKSKTCIDCGVIKLVSDFYKHPAMRDGHFNSCKECRKVYAARPERREYERKRTQTPKRQAHLKANSERWAKKYPERRHAQWAANNAIRDGRLERKWNCEKCGSPEYLHKHHHDYSKPLDVTWLCARCHARL